ncbi:hypothetical protein OIU76_017074, partial [Salix suchowensis]
MTCFNHFEHAKHTTAIATIVLALCLVAPAIPMKAREANCRITSSALKTWYAELQLEQFTTCDQY